MRDVLSGAILHVHAFFLGGSSLADGGDSSTFKVAIVTTAGVVIAAAITSYAATFQRNKAPDPAPTPAPAPGVDPLVEEVRQRALRAEARVTELETQHVDDEAEKERLENLLWLAKVNPHTGEKIT